MRKEVWFGLSIMAVVVILVFVLMPPPSEMTNGHLGLLMLALIVVSIMLGFPTAFTLMGMGMFFGWLAYRSVDPTLATRQILDLMVQRAYSVMSNDVLIAIPLFVFMGYLVERAALIDRLFRSLHLATARVPGALAVATIVTCAIFATATGIVGAVVTLMGLLAFPAMLKAGYNIKVSAGAVTAGGCLGILIPPSVLLIVYGAVAGVSVVQLYAGAFFPGIMLAGLYIGYVVLLATFKPALMPPLPESERGVALPPLAQTLAQRGGNALTGLWRALRCRRRRGGLATRRARSAVRHAAAGVGHRRGARGRLPAGDLAEDRGQHGGAGPGGRRVRGRRQGGIDGTDRRGRTGGTAGGRRPAGDRSGGRALAAARRRGCQAGGRQGLLRRWRRRRPRKPSACRCRPGPGSSSVARSPRSPFSTGSGAGSGSRSSRCCSARSSRWRS